MPCRIPRLLDVVVELIQNTDTETAGNGLRCRAQRVWYESHAAQEPRYPF